MASTIGKRIESETNYCIEYTWRQLSALEVETQYKVILFYNMAYCFQRLDMINECIEYLQKATKSLNENIKTMESQQAKLVSQMGTADQSGFATEPSVKVVKESVGPDLGNMVDIKQSVSTKKQSRNLRQGSL